MSTLRDLWTDLVEKRLWPVAVLLLAALVAVPVLLAKSAPAGDGGHPAVAPIVAAARAAADPAAKGEPVVSLAAAAPDSVTVLGHAKNPFIQQHVPPPASTAGAATGPTNGGSPGPGGGSGGSSPGGGSGGSSPGGGSNTQPQIYLTASIDVRFGRAAAPLREIKDVPRLTPLPNAASPVVIFLGMRKDLKTAVFMVSTDVHAQGDAVCVPSKKNCQAIELKADGVAFLDVTAADGSVTQYELDLVDVTVHQTTSKAAAQAAYARASKAGLAWFHRTASTSAVASVLRYSPEAGVLTPVAGTFLEGDGAPPAPAANVPQAAAGTAHQTYLVPAG